MDFKKGEYVLIVDNRMWDVYGKIMPDTKIIDKIVQFVDYISRDFAYSRIWDYVIKANYTFENSKHADEIYIKKSQIAKLDELGQLLFNDNSDLKNNKKKLKFLAEYADKSIIY